MDPQNVNFWQLLGVQLLAGWMPLPIPNQQCQSTDGLTDCIVLTRTQFTKKPKSNSGKT